jgi:rhodanese-related sulfurtransferase
MISVWKIRLIPAAVSLMLAACSAPAKNVAQPETRKPVSEKPGAVVATITLENFFQLHESGKALVIDARPSFVYQFGHVPGAINLPKSRCDEEIAKRGAEFRSAVATGKTIVVYCTGSHCPDARTVADHLAISDIPSCVFQGGWDAWKEADMPVE